MLRKVLFIDTTHPVLKEKLINLGYQCDFYPDYTRTDFENIIQEYFGIIIRSKINLDKSILEKAHKLRFIGRVGSGLESIDAEYAMSKGIACLNSPEGNRDAVGEHVIGMMLTLINNINKADSEIRKGIWERESNRGIEIKEKTIGIIGYGNMGSSFARKLKGFEVNVIAYDKYKEHYSDENICEVSLKKIFDETDILSLHVPLTDETSYMVDDTFINKFKKDIFLINSSRGKIIKTIDLVKNLKSGKIKGAALDVIEYEDTSFEKFDFNNLPEAFNYLIKAENVILTPHIAGWTNESKLKLATVLFDKIKKLTEDNPSI
jgi:D-3-phosphoglycerate dehydrogenase / 2-oxoglutarate reductase